MKLTGPHHVAELCADIASNPREQFDVLCVDNDSNLIHRETLYRGTINMCAVRVAEILQVPIRENAAAFAVVHNHPGGSLTASQADVDMTQSLSDAARLMGMLFLDHIIIGAGYASLRSAHLYRQDNAICQIPKNPAHAQAISILYDPAIPSIIALPAPSAYVATTESPPFSMTATPATQLPLPLAAPSPSLAGADVTEPPHSRRRSPSTTKSSKKSSAPTSSPNRSSVLAPSTPPTSTPSH